MNLNEVADERNTVDLNLLPQMHIVQSLQLLEAADIVCSAAASSATIVVDHLADIIACSAA